jgi:hypothetical protein
METIKEINEQIRVLEKERDRLLVASPATTRAVRLPAAPGAMFLTQINERSKK